MIRSITIGTRGSALALKQAEEVQKGLHGLYPGRVFEIRVISSQGDRDKKAPISRFGSKGIFVKELEDHLQGGEIDIAVHSLKDMPSEDPPGFRIGAIPPRLDPRDVLISANNLPMTRLPKGARLGSGSPRRAVQIKALRPDIEVLDIRGNIDTRMSKVSEGQYDGVLLAAAGLLRMDWQDRVTEYLSIDECLPAVGQGALAVEVRADDEEVLRLAGGLDHAPSRQAVDAERSLLRHMGGGCLAPIAAYAYFEDRALNIRGMVADPATLQIIRADVKCKGESPEETGAVLAEKLKSMGAASLMGDIKA